MSTIEVDGEGDSARGHSHHSTNWFTGIIVGLALVAGGYLAFSASAGAPAGNLRSSHVKVTTSTGHGSATHIGNGYFLTAAHVVDGNDTAEIDLGGNLYHPLAVLWANTEYDIALLRGPRGEFDATPLACVTPAVGVTGISFGNPTILTDIQTSMRVAGVPREIAEWRLAIPTDGALAPGMSGGGFVVDGSLAGINVGAMLAPAPGFSTSYYGVSLIVPASVVCDLMGRAA